MALTKEATANRPEVKQLLLQSEATEVQMGIDPEALSHILDRLTDMYPDPIQASVREVISNAHDATVLMPEAERKPIRVLLPTLLNTLFTVEDSGIGMSTATVQDIYSQYGASTKKDDMRLIGAYGLGAKAPLAYATEFFGETTHEGITTTFKVSRESRGNFTTILSVEETGRESGTKISIPTAGNDHVRFKEAVQYYSTYSFSCPVTINGNRAKTADYVELSTLITLDNETNTTGRVWVQRERVVELLLSHLRDGQPYWATVLSGWLYKIPGVNSQRQYDPYARSHGDGKPLMLVELKPGVVDFSSSRDAITHNVRSAAFQELVKAYLSKPEVRESMLEAYRKLSDEDARRLIAQLVENGMSLKKGKLTLPHSKKAGERLSLDYFRTDSGYDPVPLFLNEDKKVAGPGFNVNAHYGSNITYFSMWEQNNREGYGSATQTAELLGKKLSEGVNKSLTQIGLSLSPQGRHRGYYGGHEALIFFIADAKAEDISGILASRATLKRNHAYQASSIIFGEDFEEAKRQVAALETHDIHCLRVHTVKSYNDFMKELRLKLRKPKDLTLQVTKLWDKLPKVPSLKTDLRDQTKVTPAQIMEDQAILVVGDGHFRHGGMAPVLGAHNAGLKLKGKAVYHLDGNLSAAFAEQFEDYPFLLMHPNVVKQSKVVKALAENHTYYGEVSNEELKSCTQEGLLRGHFREFGMDESFAAAYASYLDTIGQTPLASVFREVTKSPYDTSEDAGWHQLLPSEAPAYVTGDQLRHFMDLQVCGPIIALRAGLKTLEAKSGTLQEALRSKLVTNGPSGNECDRELEDFFYGQAYRATLAELGKLMG